jgi:ABC-type antimicrobial peptide transport system permease subunit
MMSTPTGIDADNVLTTTVQLTRDQSSFADWQADGETHARILEQIRQQPGVLAAGGTNFLPFEVGWRNAFGIEGQPPPARQEDAPQAQMHSVSEGYFEAMGAAMAEGRAFTPFDGPAATGVVIVNETFARRFLSDGPAVGRVLLSYASGIGPLGRSLLHVSGKPVAVRYEIVGIVKDVRNAPLGQAIEPAIYFSTRQFPFREQFIAVRASDAGAALTAVRQALRSAAPNVPMAAAQTWGARFAARTAEPRLLMSVLIFFGGLAALLAALGVYGLFSWSVALRTRELAIRLTLGARPAEVGRLVIRHSIALVAIGLAAGFAIVRFAESALSRVLFEVSPGDAGSTTAAGAILFLAALVACVPPAIRAMRVDPVEGLRVE